MTAAQLNLESEAIRQAASRVAVAYNTLGVAEGEMVDVLHSDRLTIKSNSDTAYATALRTLRQAVMALNPRWEYRPGAPDSISAEQRPFKKRVFDREVSHLINKEAKSLGLVYTCEAHPLYEAFAPAARRGH